MSNFAFNKEYELSELVSFAGEKIESEKVSLDTYISTDNMLVDRGGVEPATKLPSALKFNYFKVGDTLFSNIRTYFRKVWLADFEGGASPDVLIFRTNDSEKLDPNYLYFLLSNEDFVNYTVLTAKGAKMPRGDKAAIMQYKFFLPDIDKQREIGLGLLTMNKKIELNRQTSQTLEHIAQAIFKSWFVDFEPTRAKIAAKQAGQNPERAAMAAISGKTLDELDHLSPEQQTQLKTTAALFPDALVDSELGEMPEGWVAKPFGDLLSKTIGGDWGKEEPDEKHTEKVKILRGTDLPNVYAGSDDRVPTRYVTAKKLATRKLEAGDIVIEVSGGSPTQPTGRSLYLTQEIVCRLNADLEPASFCRLFRPVEPEVGLILGLHLQKIYGEGKTWLYQNTSTGISNFQTKVFLDKELVIVPSNELKKHFYNFVIPYIKKMSSGENKDLAELRNVLLPKLLSGELSTDPNQMELNQTL